MADRTLLLLRHAKSGWDDASLDDFGRPLAQRGRKAAPLIGREMARRGWVPDMAIVSSALRTRQTWELVAAELPRTPDVTFDTTIYEARPEAILASIQMVPDRIATLLVVGHNPGMEDLAAMLASPESDPAQLARMAGKFPTAGLACFTYSGSWNRLGKETATLNAFLTPGDLP